MRMIRIHYTLWEKMEQQALIEIFFKKFSVAEMSIHHNTNNKINIYYVMSMHHYELDMKQLYISKSIYHNSFQQLHINIPLFPLDVYKC
jgi:hypothetical protein